MTSNDDSDREQALRLFEKAYRHQMKREYGEAILFYRRSITMCPTAEAHTFLGWTYSMLDRYDEAIEECHKAIAVDPEFGNPYNDIGSYLIKLDRWDEADAWLEKAIVAPRYEARHYAHMNLGRVHEHYGRYREALACYDRALALSLFYAPAHNAKYALLAKMN